MRVIAAYFVFTVLCLAGARAAFPAGCRVLEGTATKSSAGVVSLQGRSAVVEITRTTGATYILKGREITFDPAANVMRATGFPQLEAKRGLLIAEEERALIEYDLRTGALRTVGKIRTRHP